MRVYRLNQDLQDSRILRIRLLAVGDNGSVYPEEAQHRFDIHRNTVLLYIKVYNEIFSRNINRYDRFGKKEHTSRILVGTRLC